MCRGLEDGLSWKCRLLGKGLVLYVGIVLRGFWTDVGMLRLHGICVDGYGGVYGCFEKLSIGIIICVVL